MSGQIRIDIKQETCCQFTGKSCSELADEVTKYAHYLAKLATHGSSEIFTNGADPMCCRECSLYELYNNGKCK